MTDTFQGAEDGSLDFNLISLFPPTYKNRANGVRVDLAEVLEAFHPVSVFRAYDLGPFYLLPL